MTEPRVNYGRIGSRGGVIIERPDGGVSIQTTEREVRVPQRIFNPGMAHAAAERFDRILRPDTPVGRVALEIGQTNPDQRYFWTPLLTGEYLRWTCQIYPQDTGFASMMSCDVFQLLRAIHWREEGVVLSGNWTASDLHPGFYQLANNIGSTGVAGRSMTYTITGASELWLSHALRENAGRANFTLNGGTDLLDGIDLVETSPGVWQRRMDFYTPETHWGRWTRIASELDPNETYTLVITVAGNADPASSGTAVYIAGIGVPTGDIGGQSGYENEGILLSDIARNTPVWEYALMYRPAGGSTWEWTGSRHWNESITSVRFEDQTGAELIVDASNRRVLADEVVMIQEGTSRHSESGTTDLSTVRVETRATARGLAIYHRRHWLAACDLQTYYPHMWACNGTQHGTLAGDEGATYNLTGADGLEYPEGGGAHSLMGILWSNDHPYVAGVRMLNPRGLWAWQRTGGRTFIQDRAENEPFRKKVYFTGFRGATNLTSAPGEVWETEAEYMVSRYPRASVRLPI